MKYVATYFSFAEDRSRQYDGLGWLKPNSSPCKTTINLWRAIFGRNVCAEQQCLLSEGFQEKNM